MFDFKNIKRKAVIYGSLCYFGVSIITGSIVGFIISLPLIKSGEYDLQNPEAQKEMQTALFNDSTFLIGTLLVTLTASLLGGYVAARTAKVAEQTQALIIFIIIVLFGIIYSVFGSISLALWVTLANTVLQMGGLYGGASLGTSSEEPEQPKS